MFIENLHEYPVLSPAATSPTSCTAAVTVALQFSFAGLCIYIKFIIQNCPKVDHVFLGCMAANLQAG